MALKLFRSTGYSSILAPGESRMATHPRWVVLAVSTWIGFVCNVSLWRHLRGMDTGGTTLGQALLASAFVAGGCGAVLSLLGWRRTLKRAATLLLLLAALAAASLWIQGIAPHAQLFERNLRAVLVPGWPSLLRWQFPVLLMSLGLLPMLWVWQLQLRRLPGARQLVVNLTGAGMGVAVLLLTGWLLFR